MRGNHHDAWVNGAEDPISGMVALLEEARAYGTLLKQGWRPRRTIVLAAWDGEEQMLLGSTEWAETHADELANAVAYLNTDGNGRGRLGADGSPSLARLLSEVAREVKDPETGMSVWKRAHLGEVAAARAATSGARPATGPTSSSIRWAPAPTTRPSTTTSASRRSISASAASTTAGSTTRSTTASTGIPPSATPHSPMAVRWRRPPA